MEILEEAFRNHLAESLRERKVALEERLQDREVALAERLQDRKVALERACFILQVETYDRILQGAQLFLLNNLPSLRTIQIPLSLGYNDLIFKQLNSVEREALRQIGVYYSVLFLHLRVPATH